MRWLKKVTPQESEVKMVKKTSIKLNRMKIFFKSCLLFFSRRGEIKNEKSTVVKDGFSVIDNVLYYISGKTKIKIKPMIFSKAENLKIEAELCSARFFIFGGYAAKNGASL